MAVVVGASRFRNEATTLEDKRRAAIDRLRFVCLFVCFFSLRGQRKPNSIEKFRNEHLDRLDEDRC